MKIVLILLVLAFSSILCYIELPEMLRNKSYKELWCFMSLLLSGTVLAVLKALEVPLSNPSDWIAYVYSPLSELLKDILK